MLHLELELKLHIESCFLVPLSWCDAYVFGFGCRASCMSEPKDKTIALNVRLKPRESSAHQRATNYTNVGVAQGIAYVDFGFIEPTPLADRKSVV